MRWLPVPLSFVIPTAAAVGCNGILGVSSHDLAPDAGGTAFGNASGSSSGSASSGGNGSGPTNAGPADSGFDEGGPVASLFCGDSGACVYGGILSVGRPPDGYGSGTSPDGATVTLTDDGFEVGGASCDSTGTTCVTGALTP